MPPFPDPRGGPGFLIEILYLSYNNIMRIEIEKMAFGGSGLGHLDDGRVVFIRKVVPGDTVEANIYEEKKDFAFAVAEKVITPSPMRIDAPCKYFYQCGGCEHQNISYQNQLKIKEDLVRESLQRQKVTTDVEKIIPSSDKEFFYRNSIRYSFLLGQDNNIALTRHQPDDNELVIVDACMLQSETSNLILRKIRDYINKNIEDKSTFWQLKIREGKWTGDIMVEIITSSSHLPNEKGIIAELRSISGIKSIYQTIAPGKSLINLRRRLIFGSPVIFEKIGFYTFQISPESFFQTNSEGVEKWILRGNKP